MFVIIFFAVIKYPRIIYNIMNILFWNWFIITVLVLIIDGTYLSLTSSPFRNMITRIQGSPMVINIYGAILAYVAIVILIFFFTDGRKWWEIWLLGASTYGLFDATNYALFKGWNKWIALQDTIWGGTLFVLVCQAKKMLIK
jgi:uncharacterized membrane protein